MRDAPWLRLGPPSPEPSAVFIAAEAAASMDRIAMEVYRSQATEWGGVTFGRLWDIDGRLLVLIHHATKGACADASGGRVEILPESWPLGEDAIRKAGGTPGIRIGTWHSHPRMVAMPSSGMDLVAWQGYANLPHFIGIIVNPFREAGPDHSCWGWRSGRIMRLPAVLTRLELE